MSRKEIHPSREPEQIGQFFSDITGLPITYSSFFPELAEVSPNMTYARKYPFTFALHLGDLEGDYDIAGQVTFVDDRNDGQWSPKISLRVGFEGEPISQVHVSTLSTKFHRNRMWDKQAVEAYLLDELADRMGGPNSDTYYMDFEQYVLDDIKKESSLRFAYLILMTHMKERGLPMPPILGKHEMIKELMEKGKIEELQKALSSVLVFDAADYDQRCQAHMRAEAEVIKERAYWENRRRDRLVPIYEVFPYVQLTRVEGQESPSGPCTILVVENDFDLPWDFTQEVKSSLERDGRYGKSTLIRTTNIADCQELSVCGRVDLILYDWKKPSYEEALMMKKEHLNPFFQMYFGDDNTHIIFDKEGLSYNLPDGNQFYGEEGLKEEGMQLDMREEWMDTIRTLCLEEGIAPPPYFIVRSRAEQEDLAAIISQKLGNSIR